MATPSATGECPPDVLAAAVVAVQGEPGEGLRRLAALIAEHPQDGRLRFLQGALLADQRQYGEAATAMRRAVELAPDFVLARFQLGFLELTSGQATAALAAWGPLQVLPAEDPLRLFAEGLTHLIRDEFAACAEKLRAGVERNTENPPLNHDMQLILAELQGSAPGAEAEAAAEPPSASHLLLQQYASRRPH